MDKEITTPRTLQEAIVYFSNPNIAHRYARALRWPDGVVTCPRCGSTDVWALASARQWKCKVKHSCRKFTVKIGSIMEDSPLGLDKWLAAIWLLAGAKNGISSYEIHRGLGITQKSAWFLLQRIRLAMQTGTFGKMGGGPIEVDETFIGGKARFMHADKRKEKIKGTGGSGKVAVAGLLARHGHGGKKHSTVRVQVVNSRKRNELDPLVRQHVAPGSEIMTDELPSYNDLAPDYVHKVVNHAECYVKGNVHTNGLENFWSLLKRSIQGTYVSVEPFHLFRYLDEQAFRFNERKHEDGDAGRFEIAASQMFGKRLTYKQLIGEAPDSSLASAN